MFLSAVAEGNRFTYRDSMLIGDSKPDEDITGFEDQGLLCSSSRITFERVSYQWSFARLTNKR